ncbi:MAG: hypothetical protein AAFW89_05765 [Bacteroidota bacterium]
MRYVLLSSLLLALFSSALSAQQYDNDLLYRKWRVTLFQPIGTNGTKSLNYTAKRSINLLYGYHGGLEGWEVGVLVNRTKYDVNGVQLAGLANITHDDYNGMGIAGLLNYTDDDVSGFQIAGLSNFNKGNMEGMLIAGGFNISGQSMTGLQAALLGNYSSSYTEGLQASGFLNYSGGQVTGLRASGGFNINKGYSEGLAAAGIANISEGHVSGLYAAGVFNLSPSFEGLAAAGLANISREAEGLQFAMGANITEKAEGLQIAFINIAKEFNGAPIAFLNLYGNGRYNVGTRYSDAGFNDFSLTTGTHRVYNSLIFGTNSSLDRDVYRFGLAVGVEKNIQDSFEKIKSNSLFVNQEFSILHHFEGDWDRTTNLLFSYRYMVGKRFGDYWSVYAGPTLNALVSRVDAANDYTWYSLWSPTRNGRQYRFWVGFTLGTRLFKQKNLPLMDDENWNY